MGEVAVYKGLGAAALHQRFTHEDLVSIATTGSTVGPTHTVTGQDRWLSQGTSSWAHFGTTAAAPTNDDFEGAIDER